MPPTPAIHPTKRKPDPEQCADCAARAKPGEKVPKPVLERESDKQREFKCPKCGLVHIVGNPASTTSARS